MVWWSVSFHFIHFRLVLRAVFGPIHLYMLFPGKLIHLLNFLRPTTNPFVLSAARAIGSTYFGQTAHISNQHKHWKKRFLATKANIEARLDPDNAYKTAYNIMQEIKQKGDDRVYIYATPIPIRYPMPVKVLNVQEAVWGVWGHRVCSQHIANLQIYQQTLSPNFHVPSQTMVHKMEAIPYALAVDVRKVVNVPGVQPPGWHDGSRSPDGCRQSWMNEMSERNE